MEISECKAGILPTSFPDLYFQGGRLSEFVSVLVKSELNHIAEEISNNLINIFRYRVDSMRAY